MRITRIVTLVVLALLVLTTLVSAEPPVSKNFVAVLSGGNEVPARETNARGAAIFQVSEDGSSMTYKLIVAKLDNAVAAHIHCGAEGVNAPVGVNLYQGAVASGRLNGVIADGTITDPNLTNGCGWTMLSQVVDAMLSGNAYVNVHTNDGEGASNTGPGDFAAGEIRGQVFEGGPTK